MSPDELIEEAEHLGDDEEYDEAIALLDRVLAMKLAKAKRVRALMARAALYDDRASAAMDVDEHHPRATAVGKSQPARAASEGDHARAIADCDAALALDPESPAVLYLRATIYSSVENWKATMRDLDAAIALEAPSATPEAKSLWPDLHELRGLARYNLGDHAGARDDFGIAIDGNEDIEPRFHLYRGMAALLLDKPADAIADFDSALEREPDDIKALAQRAKAREACGDFAAALADLDHLATLMPPSPLLEEHRERLRAQLPKKPKPRKRKKG